jgi:hypothetical protein
MTAGRFAVGTVLVGIGVLFIVDAFGGAEAGDIVAEWWPLGLIVLGGAQIAIDLRISLASAVLVGAGVFALAGTTGLLEGRVWSIAWPVALIGLGAWLAFGRRRPTVVRRRVVTRLALLASSNLSVRSREFRRADLTAVLGGIRLDLTGAELHRSGARVSAAAVLGSVIVVVPQGWRVRVRGLPVFGGWDDTTSRVVPDDAPVLEIRALVVLGGVEARHPHHWV